MSVSGMRVICTCSCSCGTHISSTKNDDYDAVVYGEWVLNGWVLFQLGHFSKDMKDTISKR